MVSPRVDGSDSAPPAPVAAAHRIEHLDILRGFALFGVLLVNMAAFSSSFFADMAGRQWSAPLDRAAAFLISLLAEGKFISIFSLLFGLGFTIQLERAEARGGPFLGLYFRRLLVLLIFGLVHGFLIWMGDVLVTYALLGFFLFWFRHRSPRTLLVWIIVLLSLLLLLALASAGLDGSSQEGMLELAEAADIYRTGTYLEILEQRAIEVLTLNAMIVVFGPYVFAMFLIGVLIGQKRILHEVSENHALFRRLIAWGLPIGLSVSFLNAFTLELATGVDFAAKMVLGGVALVAVPAQSLAYLSIVVLLAGNPDWGPRLRPLAAVGRMALTNYLLQSVICTLIFNGYGLGYFGEVGPALGIVLTVTIFSIQIVVSGWWLRHFRFGPMEWLWRSLTYLRRQPMREGKGPE